MPRTTEGLPAPMAHSTQAIVCLANDLRGTAEALHWKREHAGDVQKRINGEEQLASSVHYWPNVQGLPKMYSRSRLIIVGHGNPESTHIMGNGVQWTPEELNTQVGQWLDNSVIERISLHMCYGAGNPAGEFDVMPVAPDNSFAAAFARVCKYARSFSGRTSTTTVQTTTRDVGGAPTVVNVRRIVGDAGRHKGAGDKYVFLRQDDGGIRMQWLTA